MYPLQALRLAVAREHQRTMKPSKATVTAVTAAMEAVEALERQQSLSMSSQQALQTASSKKQYPVAPAQVAPVVRAEKAGMDAS